LSQGKKERKAKRDILKAKGPKRSAVNTRRHSDRGSMETPKKGQRRPSKTRKMKGKAAIVTWEKENSRRGKGKQETFSPRKGGKGNGI